MGEEEARFFGLAIFGAARARFIGLAHLHTGQPDAARRALRTL
jgi:hypothetical protein